MLRFVAMNLREMSRKELDKLFDERRRALIEVRDEIDRRERKPVASVDFCDYVGDGIENEKY